jgi:hypothetical protein
MYGFAFLGAFKHHMLHAMGDTRVGTIVGTPCVYDKPAVDQACASNAFMGDTQSIAQLVKFIVCLAHAAKIHVRSQM